MEVILYYIALSIYLTLFVVVVLFGLYVSSEMYDITKTYPEMCRGLPKKHRAMLAILMVVWKIVDFLGGLILVPIMGVWPKQVSASYMMNYYSKNQKWAGKVARFMLRVFWHVN